ncbi:MAG: GerMN domain-containing protein, partial [Spirochaetota bacterium]
SDDADGASERSERSRSTEQESGQESADSDDSSDSSDSSDSPDASDTPEQDEQPDNQEESEPTNELALNLYYVRITDDGAFPEPVERTIEYSDSPLTQTVRTLLQGPTSEEVGDGLLDLIPDGTQLLRASVRNGVAYLDFNDAFRFNPMGVEGYRLQLQQIIYVTTQFSTVDRVQFLIEGERHEWLGGEGVYIGSPLGRSSFS